MSEQRRIVIVGGGFAGIGAAQRLRKANASILLIDRRNHHLFQPLLYQVATAALAPADIAEPIRAILNAQANVEIVLGAASSVDAVGSRVRVDDRWVSYDWLILAAGGHHAYFGHPEWEQHAPGLKTIGDALEIRRRILLAYERAEWMDNAEERRRLMTFVVVGGGATGVELAGAIADIARRTLREDFRHIKTEDTRIVLVEGTDKVLGNYPDPLPAKAKKQLESLGVEVLLKTMVTDVDARGVDLGEQRIDAGTVIWAAGVKASEVGQNAEWPRDKAGRVRVSSDLSVPGAPNVFVVGDQASIDNADGSGVPGVAPAALQMGKHAADNVLADLSGRSRTPFRYTDRGSMATIGRARAIATTGPLKLSGVLAWLSWVFIHILFLITFRNRVVVMLKWAWAWTTSDRSSRLLWETEPSANPREVEADVVPDETPADRLVAGVAGHTEPGLGSPPGGRE